MKVMFSKQARSICRVLFHQFVDGLLQTSGHELVFQGDGEHHHLIIVAGFEF